MVIGCNGYNNLFPPGFQERQAYKTVTLLTGMKEMQGIKPEPLCLPLTLKERDWFY
jgi:hypothetical protein